MASDRLQRRELGPGTTQFRDAVLYVGGMVFQQLLGLLAGIVIARQLGPSDYGVLSVVRNAFTIVLVLTPLGLNISILRYAAESESLSRLVAQIALIRTAIAVATVLVAVLLFLGGAAWLETHFYRHQGFATYLSIIFLGLPFATDAVIMAAVFRAWHRPAIPVVITSYCEPVVRLATIALSLFLGLGLGGVVSATAIAYVSSSLWLTIAFIALSRNHVPRHAIDRMDVRAIRSLMGYSIWIGATSIVYSGLRNVDVLLLGIFRPAAEVGDYAVLSTVAQLIQFFPQAISQTLGPTIAAQYIDRDFNALGKSLNSYLRNASLLASPVFAGAAVFGPWLDLVFGAKFVFSPAISFSLSLGYFIAATLSPIGFALSMTGRHRAELAILSAGAALTCGALLAIVPIFGSVGAAATVAAGFLAVNAMRALVVRRIFGIVLGHWRDLYPPVAALALAWIARWLAELLVGRNLAGLVLAAAIFAAVAAAAGWLLFLTPSERLALKQRLLPLLARKAR